jgi:hypothetical protein
VVAFFTLAAARGSGESNWAAAAYLSGALALANAAGRIGRAAWIAVGTNTALSTLLISQFLSPWLPLHGGIFDQVGRGRDLAASVEAWGVAPVYTSRYQEAALLSFYEGIEAYALPKTDRPDQYDLWPVRWPTEGEKALFVRPWKGGPTATVDAFCLQRGPANVVSEHDASGNATMRWQVYEVSGCGSQETLLDRASASVRPAPSNRLLPSDSEPPPSLFPMGLP